MLTLLFEVANANLLFGFIPESLGMMLFGLALIVSTVVFRRIFSRRETAPENFSRAFLKSNQQ